LIIWVWGAAPSNFLKMKLNSDLPVYKSCCYLLLEIFLFAKEFNKEHKFKVSEISKNNMKEQNQRNANIT